MKAIYVIGFIWALPATIIGFFLQFLYGIQGRRTFNDQGVLEVRVKRIIPKFAAAQTWGIIVFSRIPFKYVRTHEYAHVRQWMVWGPFFLIAYPLASVWARIKHGEWYEHNYFEVGARKFDERQRTKDNKNAS